MLQVVYVLTNPGMLGFAKIGMTSGEDVGIRLLHLKITIILSQKTHTLVKRNNAQSS